MKTGHKTRMWCCQDTDRKQKARPSQKENAKPRDTVGMVRFGCKSSLIISCKSDKDTNVRIITIRLQHHVAHTPYYDVAMPPEAVEMIRESLEWSAPNSLVPKIQSLHPSVTANQVHAAWTLMSETLWKRDAAQLPSAKILLDEFADDVDVFHVAVEDGVEQLCWGMKKILTTLR